MTKKNVYRLSILIAMLCIVLLLSGCSSVSASDNKDYSKSKPLNCEQRIAATSMATVYIMEKLDLDLVAVPHSDVDELPERYKDVPDIGSPMSPDQEKIAMIHPSWVIGPSSLAGDLIPVYEKLNLNYGFINLNNIPGMYKSIEDLGDLFNRREQAMQLVNEYKAFMKEYEAKHPGGSDKRVLILMGLPGSYVAATENSYAGSLVKLAGGHNIYDDQKEAFINVNVEDMLTRDPDIILRTSHAMPDEVKEMFSKEFKENPNWSHFRAVETGKVYDLDHDRFGMSAKFNYTEALDDLEDILYDS